MYRKNRFSIHENSSYIRIWSFLYIVDKKKYENLVVEVAKGKVTKEEMPVFLEHG